MKRNKLNVRWLGIILGLIGPVVGLAIVFGYFILIENFEFEALWHEFMLTPDQKSRFISLSILFNLAIFYFFLRKDWNRSAMGVVLGTMVYIPIVLYLKFFA